MLGAIAIVVVLLVFPIVVALSGALAAYILGSAAQADVEERHAGSELLALNE